MHPPLLRARANGDPDFIGPYRVRARLGGGGFGTVYAATGPGGELVAVKAVHQHVLEGLHDFRARFRREIRAMERVESDFVPALVAGQTADDPPWLATELVPGVSLEKVVARCDPLPENAVWQLAAGMAKGLAAVHAANLFHRDLKPHNVLLTPDRPWIIDFGLVRLSELPNHDSSQITIATCDYAPPEQLRDGLRGASKPADIFGFGATLLFAATGHPPHEAENNTQLLLRALNSPPNLAGLPPGLFGLVERCLAREESARPSLDQVRREIARRTRVTIGEEFSAGLPGPVIRLLEGFREDLASVLRARGPSTRGWGSPPAPEEDDGSGLLPPVEDLGTQAPPPSAEAESLPVTRPDGHGGLAATARMPQPLIVWSRVSARRRPREDNRATTPNLGQTPDTGGAWRHEPVLDRGSQLVRDPRGRGWTRYFGGWICSPVAVHDETCVVACRDGTVSGLRAEDGGERWRADLGGPVSCAPSILPDGTGRDGIAFAAAPDGSLHAFGLAAGDDRVVLPPGAAIEGAPVPVKQPGGDLLYVIRSNGSLHAVDPRTGEAHLVRRLDGGATGALAATAEVIAAADARGAVQLINPYTGRLLRLLRTEGLVLGAPVLTAGRVYAASTDGRLRWADIMAEGEGEVTGLDGAPVHAAPVTGGGRLYVGDSGGRVYACGLRERGSRGPVVSWTSRPLGAEIVGLAASDEKLYATAGNRLFEIDARGDQVARVVIEMNCLIGAAPVISGRFGYAVGLGGAVQRFALR